MQSAIVGRSPATNGCAPMAASSTFRLAARRVFAFSAASGDCLNRLAMNGCVFWKYWPTALRMPSSAMRSSSRTRARSRGVVPSMGGVGWSSSRYSMMASDSLRQLPSSSSRTGRPPIGFFFKNSGLRLSPVTMLTGSKGMRSPFSAR